MILNGWKEIAVYVGRGVRTVQRWENLGLPVRRHAGRKRSAICAVSDEIDFWLRAHPQDNFDEPALPEKITALHTRVFDAIARHRSLVRHQRDLLKQLRTTWNEAESTRKSIAELQTSDIVVASRATAAGA